MTDTGSSYEADGRARGLFNVTTRVRQVHCTQPIGVGGQLRLDRSPYPISQRRSIGQALRTQQRCRSWYLTGTSGSIYGMPIQCWPAARVNTKVLRKSKAERSPPAPPSLDRIPITGRGNAGALVSKQSAFRAAGSGLRIAARP